MNVPVLALGPEDEHEQEHEYDGDRAAFRTAVLEGLSRPSRAIPARFLYDEAGSALFDAICEVPEYYLTRTETDILKLHAADIASRAGPGCALIEFGSGSSVKSRLLLDALKDPALYAPVDISRDHLDQTAHRLRRDYPGLAIEPVCADYMMLEALPAIAPGTPRLGFFPGSTIGNLEPHEARSFLRRARRLLADKGAMVLGVDLRKDPLRLHAAYNDEAGVTASFTLNLLRRMNRELGATFDPSQFAHDASYNSAEGRIEIYFRSLRRQSVMVAGHSFAFAEGQRVHTEYSYKYDIAGLASLASDGGFVLSEVWTDPGKLFAVAWLSAA